jgi:hypothetical protein
MNIFWFMLLFGLLSWAATISGVLLGGFLVYRTKRDPYDSMFSRADNTGASFNIDDDMDQGDSVEQEVPKATESANNAFIGQFAEALGKK